MVPINYTKLQISISIITAIQSLIFFGEQWRQELEHKTLHTIYNLKPIIPYQCPEWRDTRSHEMKHNGALVAGPIITKLYRFRMAQIVSYFVALPTYGLPWETRIAWPANICPPVPNSICQGTVFFRHCWVLTIGFHVRYHFLFNWLFDSLSLWRVGKKGILPP